MANRLDVFLGFWTFTNLPSSRLWLLGDQSRSFGGGSYERGGSLSWCAFAGCGGFKLFTFLLNSFRGEAWDTATGEDDGPRPVVLALVLFLRIEYILEQSLFACVVCVLRCWAFVAGTWGKIGVMSLDLKERFCKGYFTWGGKNFFLTEYASFRLLDGGSVADGGRWCKSSEVG